ncbi:hypothetical protein [Nitrosococcus watsonii]|uniref:Uncharacterized protein n=1 Tax=Nitrosococcus watsoni (strain C-113) TaxID=105559 RepID=D8K6X3_NITWC|nr:hypothetical protein [Nitrosococcus watsonii]ADJ28650.1 hypothetical protein Nwat_1789 [Nitrosococcus watsonii C-113]
MAHVFWQRLNSEELLLDAKAVGLFKLYFEDLGQQLAGGLKR